MNKKVISILTLLIILISSILGITIKLKELSKKQEQNIPKPLNNGPLSIMVYDKATSSYKEQSSIPTGNYEINTTKTTCIAGGTISNYNSSAGTITYSLSAGDICYVYFDPSKSAPTFVPSATTLSTDYYGSATTSTVTLNYNGDGAITCSPTSGTYSNCNVSGKTVTFTKKAVGGPENFTITAAETNTYKAATQIVAVSWTCLDEDTLVAYWDRKKKKKLKKRIKDFKEGDIVYSYDEKAQGFVTRKVKQLVVTKTKEIYHIFVDGEDIKTTATHPFYINGAGYLNASMVKAGCELISADGEVKIVEKVEVEVLAEEKTMYCLELEEGGSSFAVGTTGIICLAMFVDGLALLLTPSKIAFAEWTMGSSGGIT